jgi:hypothetical protein
MRAEKRARNQMTEPEGRLTYRAYVFGPDNHIIQPPKLIEAFGDEQAIETARRMVDGHALEVWDQQRLVIRLEPRTGPEPI